MAFRVLRRVFEEGAYADRAFTAEADRAGLDPRDRALAMRLAYGAVQRARTLDHLAERLTGRPADRLDAPTRAGLRLGLLQLHFLEVADHAAVSEAVELVKGDSPGGGRLVNAVLRRAAREKAPALPDDTPHAAALAHSVPDWLADLWWAELGPDDARALLRTVNEPPEHALRVNALVPNADLSGIPAVPAPEPPEALVLTGPWDAFGAPEWQAGAVHPQSRASMLAVRALDPQPGELVLDLCAAPGGKTTHLAALMAGRGGVVAVERHAGRAEALRRTAERLHADNVGVVVGDATTFSTSRPFDRVLVDPPCSGLGTLQSRPDLRWRASPEQIAELAGLQERILAAGERALKPGGTLVYSVCTLSAAELPDRPWAWSRTVLPHRDGTEGFAIARLSDVAA